MTAAEPEGPLGPRKEQNMTDMRMTTVTPPAPETPPPCTRDTTPRLIPERVIAHRWMLARVWWAIFGVSLGLMVVLGGIGSSLYPDTDGNPDNGNPNIPGVMVAAVTLLSLAWLAALVVAWVYSYGARANVRADREAVAFERRRALPDREPRRVNHILHAILTILTGGFWAIIWLALILRHRNI